MSDRSKIYPNNLHLLGLEVSSDTSDILALDIAETTSVFCRAETTTSIGVS